MNVKNKGTPGQSINHYIQLNISLQRKSLCQLPSKVTPLILIPTSFQRIALFQKLQRNGAMKVEGNNRKLNDLTMAYAEC